MPTSQKIATVAELSEKMQRMQLAVVADYRGLTVAEMSEMRKKLRDVGSELVVAKNTLLLIAARQTGHEAIEPLLSGPTAVAFVYDDVAKAARTINDFTRQTPKPLVVRGGLLGKTAIGADGLEQVTRMPNREQALGQVLGAIQAPVAGVVGVLNAAISNVMYVLQARIDQLQPADTAAPPA